LVPTDTVCTLAVLAVLITATWFDPGPPTTSEAPFGVTAINNGDVTPDEKAVPAVKVDVFIGVIVLSEALAM
jgi:hypothetical protein